MTAIDEFFKKDIDIIERIHNSQIILERIDEIEGTSENILDDIIKSIKRMAIDSELPIIDTFIDFAQLSMVEGILKIFDFRVTELVEGREKVPRNVPVIFAGNHETELEHLYLARACCPTRDLDYPFKIFKFLNPRNIAEKRHVPIFFAKYQLFNMPIISSFFSATAFPVERELKDTKSIEIGSRFLQRGSNIWIYPEGTRNLKTKQSPKSGVIRLAIKNKVPIVPVGQVGLWDLTKGSFIPQKQGYWACTFGEPIYYDEYYDQELDYTKLRVLIDQLMERIEGLKEIGNKKLSQLYKEKSLEVYQGSINEIVVNKFNKLYKVPKNPIDTLYRWFVDASSKIPLIGDRIDAISHLISRWGTELLVNPLTFDLRIYGKENLENQRPAIIASNHESFLDILVYGLKLAPTEMINYRGYLGAGKNHDINEKVWFMMKRELAEIPILSSWTLSAGGFPVARGESDVEAVQVAEELVKRNRNVVIFPQGTTRPEIDVESGKTGAVRMAINTKRPIIPIAIKGSNEVMKKGVWKLLFPPKAYPITINIGKPITYEEYYDKELNYEEAKTLTRDLMVKIKELHEEEMGPGRKTSNILSPLDRIIKNLGSMLGFPRRDLQEVATESRIEKYVNRIFDGLGITSTSKGEDKPRDPVQLNLIDSFLLGVKSRAEKLGLPKIDDQVYTYTKVFLEMIVNNLYNFQVKGVENIPVDEDVGIILLAQSSSKLDFLIGSCLIPQKVHFMIDTKTYKRPVVSTLLQTLGFFRQPKSQVDFGAILNMKTLLEEKKILGIFPEVKNKARLIRTFAGIVKLGLDGRPSVIVPLSIAGTDTPFPPVKIRVAIGKPVPLTKRMKKSERYELAEKLVKDIKALKTETYKMKYKQE